MISKRFYRRSAAERQRESRRRTTAIELHSKLNELEVHGFQTNVTDEMIDAIPMLGEDHWESTNNDNYCQSDNGDCCNKSHTVTSSSDDEGDSTSSDDNDGDDEVIREFINSFDVNREQKLYSACNLSIYNACIEIIKLSKKLNLNKLQMQYLLNGLRSLLPTENKLPRTVPSLLRIVGRYLLFLNTIVNMIYHAI